MNRMPNGKRDVLEGRMIALALLRGLVAAAPPSPQTHLAGMGTRSLAFVLDRLSRSDLNESDS